MCDLLDTTLQYHVSHKIQGNFGVHTHINTVDQGVSPGRSMVGKKTCGHLDTSKVSAIWKETVEKAPEKLPKGLPQPLGKMKITKPVQFIKQHCGCFLAIFHSHMKYIKRKIYVKKVGNQYQVADDISNSDLTFMSMQLIKIAQISDMEHASTRQLVLKWYWKCICLSETHG